MQLKKSYKRIDQIELKAHQDKIDRQIADAQERRRYERLGGKEFYSIDQNEMRRYEIPRISRNIKAESEGKDRQ